jgi:hypothetical protein
MLVMFRSSDPPQSSLSCYFAETYPTVRYHHGAKIAHFQQRLMNQGTKFLQLLHRVPVVFAGEQRLRCERGTLCRREWRTGNHSVTSIDSRPMRVILAICCRR